MKNDETRQNGYTELTASCGHIVHIRVDVNPVIAADMIATFTNEDCGNSKCSVTRTRKAARLPHTSINDVGARG